MDKNDIAKMIDHTLLKADGTITEVEKLCKEAKEYNFASVCVNPSYVKKAFDILKDTNVKVCTVIGFPLGANSTNVKVFEARQAVNDGATEIDMVIDIGAAKSGDFDLIEKEVKEVVKEVRATNKNAIVKVIIETALLNEEEKQKVITLLLNTGAEFVKTSTGFSTGGATVEDIALMKSIVKDNMKIKASGGIRDYATFMKMKEAGADRVGASSGIDIANKK